MSTETITVILHDGDLMELPLDLVKSSGLLSECLQCSPIPIPKTVSRNDMTNIARMWTSNGIDETFVANLTSEDLFSVILAANVLGMNQILDAGAKQVATYMNGLTPKQIQEFYDIPSSEETSYDEA